MTPETRESLFDIASENAEELYEEYGAEGTWVTKEHLPSCPAPRLFVGTGQVQRRIISWELARGARDNLTMGRA